MLVLLIKLVLIFSFFGMTFIFIRAFPRLTSLPERGAVEISSQKRTSKKTLFLAKQKGKRLLGTGRKSLKKIGSVTKKKIKSVAPNLSEDYWENIRKGK